MAQRRMFSSKIIGSDAFLELPLTSQALYFHLGMNADDDGFVGNALSVMRMVGADRRDLQELIESGFLVRFDSGVVAIVHWHHQNKIRPEIYRETIYTVEKALLAATPHHVRRETSPHHVRRETSNEASNNSKLSRVTTYSASQMDSKQTEQQVTYAGKQADRNINPDFVERVTPELVQTGRTDESENGCASEVVFSRQSKERIDKSNIVKYNTHCAAGSTRGQTSPGNDGAFNAQFTIHNAQLQTANSRGKTSNEASNCLSYSRVKPYSALETDSELIKQNINPNFVEGGRKTCFGRNDFIPPDVETVKAYCRERCNGIDAEEFVDFYASKGWMIGKWRMVDWRAAVRSWEHNRKKTSTPEHCSEPTFDVGEFFSAALAKSYEKCSGS